MERVNRSVLHGTSVPDVVSIIDEMVIDVWTKLSWEEQFYTHAALLEAVRTCALDYIRAIYNKVQAENFYGAKKELGINEKVCVVMSNAYAIFEHLFTTKNKIKRRLRIAESKYGFTIMDPMASIGNQMQMEVAAIYLIVLREIQKVFERYIKKAVRGTLDIFMSSSTVIAEACAYIEKVLEVLYLNLKTEAFYIVLRHLWIIALATLKRGLSHWRSCWRKKTAYIAALQTLTQLQEIFYCDGHGLSQQEIRNSIFEGLKKKIEIKLKIQDRSFLQKTFLCV